MPHYVETMFSSMGREPWHRHPSCKVISEEAVTAEQAIKLADLDWIVKLQPLSVAGVVIKDNYAVCRYRDGAFDPEKDVLGIVGARYWPVQNHELFKFFDPVVDRDKGIFYQTGGSLKGGRIVWLLAKVPGDFWLPDVPEDRIASYLLLGSSHDGSMHIIIKPTAVRVVCWNTFSMAIHGPQTVVRIKHTANAQNELLMAHKVLGLATKNSAALKEVAEALLGLKITNRFLKSYLQKLFPSIPEKRGEKPSKQAIERRERVEILFAEVERNNLKGMERTGWALLNATTDYVDHEWPARKDTDELYRSWMGTGDTLKAKAMRLLMQQLQKGDVDA